MYKEYHKKILYKLIYTKNKLQLQYNMIEIQLEYIKFIISIGAKTSFLQTNMFKISICNF